MTECACHDPTCGAYLVGFLIKVVAANAIKAWTGSIQRPGHRAPTWGPTDLQSNWQCGSKAMHAFHSHLPIPPPHSLSSYSLALSLSVFVFLRPVCLSHSPFSFWQLSECMYGITLTVSHSSEYTPYVLQICKYIFSRDNIKEFSL